MQFLDKKHKRVHINITSLIDVLFLLLIFFMVSSTFLEQPGMKLDLPETSQQSTVKLENQTIFVSKDETIALNDNVISLETLADSLNKIAPLLGDKGIVLKADEQVRYGLVVEVMDIIKSSKIEKLIVATEIKQKTNSQ